METEIADITQEEQDRLRTAGWEYFMTSWEQSIWKHPDHPGRNLYPAEALALIEDEEG